MRVLVACEFSGTVRDAFLARGHKAVSCDLRPSDRRGPHIMGDVRLLLGYRWDLMIAHPPCTYLCGAGVKWLHDPAPSTPTCLRGEDRRGAMRDAGAFFTELLQAPIPRIAVENPRPHSEAVAMIGTPDQYVQPWMHGHPEKKATGLWLRNLPPLEPTDDVQHHMATLPKSETDRMHRVPPGPDRERIRSTTYAGIAEAMADQWGRL